MGRTLKPPRVIRSVSLSYEFDKICRENEISISEATRRGISLMLSEKGIKDYDNDLNIVRRVQELKVKAAEALQKIADLEKCQTKDISKEEEKNIN
jgi:hypothetical protein